MYTESKHLHGRSIPVILAIFVAVAGQALVLFNDFGPGTGSRASATMITAAALSRAGAIEIPTTPASRPTA